MSECLFKRNIINKRDFSGKYYSCIHRNSLILYVEYTLIYEQCYDYILKNEIK